MHDFVVVDGMLPGQWISGTTKGAAKSKRTTKNAKKRERKARVLTYQDAEEHRGKVLYHEKRENHERKAGQVGRGASGDTELRNAAVL